MKAKAFSLKKDNGQVISPITVRQSLPVSIPPTSTVRLNNLRTGRVVRMGFKAANMLSAKYPNEFKIM